MKYSKILLLLLIFATSAVNCKTHKFQNTKKYQDHNHIHVKESNGDSIYYYVDTSEIKMDSLISIERTYDENLIGGKGRRIVKRNWKALVRNKSYSSLTGKISIMICVNRSGNVIYAETLPKETTIEDVEFLKSAVNAAKGYTVEADQNASIEECGKLVFELDVNARIK